MSHESRKNGHLNTYFIESKDQLAELARLRVQDQMLTTSMGGPLIEQTPPEPFQRVLDIGCGSGGWIMDLAQLFPALELVGIDISQQMVQYATPLATKVGLSSRVTFKVMDALKPLTLPDATFDLVNMRLGSSFLRTWDWPNLLNEARRVTRSGGVIRLVDTENGHQSNSAALTQLFILFANALFQAGHIFSNDSMGLVSHLPRLLAQFGYTQIQSRIFPLEFRAGTPEGDAYYKDLEHLQVLRSFILKWKSISGDFDTLYQQALRDARQSNFVVSWPFHVVWGTRL